MSKPAADSELTGIIRCFHLFGVGPAATSTMANQFHLLYSAFCTLTVSIILISTVFINKVIQKQFEHFLIRAISFGSLFFTHFIILSQTIYYRKQQRHLFSKITDIDNIFSDKLRMRVCYSTERRIVYRKVGILWSVLTIIQIGFVCNAFRSMDMILFWLHCLYSSLVITMTFIQIVFYVDLLARRIDRANRKLHELTMMKELRKRCPEEPKKSLHWNRKDEFSVNKSMGEMPISTTHICLLDLKRTYSLLYELSNMINSTFGWRLLVITVQYFIIIITHAYWLFLVLKTSEPDVRVALDYVFTFTPNVILLCVICYSCYGCSQKVNDQS